MNRNTFIEVLPLPEGEDRKLFYNHLDVIAGHTYRAISINSRDSVEIDLHGRYVYLPRRCYRWVSPEENP